MFTGHSMEMKESLSQRTAILLFANSPEEEMRQKSFVKAKEFFYDLTYHTLETLKETEIPVIHYSEHEQKGDNFGERFYNAIRGVFDLGYESVITVGNDTPQLQSSQILKASEKLNEGMLVLGPSIDGGFYLMGLNRSHFASLSFNDLPWQTTGLYTTFVSQIHSYGWKFEVLKTFRDLDDLGDLMLLVQRTGDLPDHVLLYYYSVIGKAFKPFNPEPDFTHLISIPSLYNKGSPHLGLI